MSRRADDSALGVVVTCEHASNDVPGGTDLGVPRAVLDSHVAWDRWAREVAEGLSTSLRAPFFPGRFTRLYVDLNRSEAEPSVIPARCFGVTVPGNARLDEGEREDRLAVHRTHWRDVHDAIGEAIARHGRCLHVAIHTFDATLDASRKNLDAGVLYDPLCTWEARIAAQWLAELAGAHIRAAPNQPYVGTDDGLTTSMRTRFEENCYAGIEIECSQSFVTSRSEGERLAAVLAAQIARLARVS